MRADISRAAVVALVSTIAVSGAFAQAEPPEDENPNRVIISAGTTVPLAVEGMAKAAGATVAVDPALTGRVSAATAKLPLEQGLTAIAQQNRAKWLKVYLDEKLLPRTADGKVDARRLKVIVEAATAAPAQTVGVVDPATGQMTVTSRAAETDPMMQAWAKGKSPVYLLYVPGAEPTPTPPTAGPGALPPGGIEALRQMTPEQRKQWMDQHGGVIITSDMTPEERAAMLNRLPPEERERMQQRLQQGGDQVMIYRHQEQRVQ